MGDEVFEADPVLGVPLKQVVQQVGELGRSATWHAGSQSSVPLVELLQSLRGKAVKPGSTYLSRVDMLKVHLRSLGLEGRLACEALKDDCPEGPEVRLGVVLQRHDHLRRHVHRGPAQRRRHHAVLQEPREACRVQIFLTDFKFY